MVQTEPVTHLEPGNSNKNATIWEGFIYASNAKWIETSSTEVQKDTKIFQFFSPWFSRPLYNLRDVEIIIIPSKGII